MKLGPDNPVPALADRELAATLLLNDHGGSDSGAAWGYTILSMANPNPTPEDASSPNLEVLTALVALDQSSNESSQQATTAIIGIVLAYLGVTAFVINSNPQDLPVPLVLAVPAPVLLLQMLQMVWAAAVVKRAKSAELMEEAIFRKALVGEPELQDHYRHGRLGSQATTRLTDITHAGDYGWGSYVVPVIGMLPYLGFYALTTAFVWHVVISAYGMAGKVADVIERASQVQMVNIAAIFYFVLVFLFFVGVLAAYVAPFDRTKLDDPTRISANGDPTSDGSTE